MGTGITEREYIERNLKGFEGDSILESKIKSVIESYGVKTVIETGTFKGGTTAKFCNMAHLVITFENNLEYYKEASARLNKMDNLIMIRGESQRYLDHVLKDNILDLGMCLFFLDAHWYDHCPLLDELNIIAQNKLKPVIVIHDFKVPGTDLGFDTYKGRALDWSYIEDAVRRVYGNGGFKYEYNEEAEGARRGVIIIYPVM